MYRNSVHLITIAVDLIDRTPQVCRLWQINCAHSFIDFPTFYHVLEKQSKLTIKNYKNTFCKPHSFCTAMYTEWLSMKYEL